MTNDWHSFINKPIAETVKVSQRFKHKCNDYNGVGIKKTAKKQRIIFSHYRLSCRYNITLVVTTPWSVDIVTTRSQTKAQNILISKLPAVYKVRVKSKRHRQVDGVQTKRHWVAYRPIWRGKDKTPCDKTPLVRLYPVQSKLPSFVLLWMSW